MSEAWPVPPSRTYGCPRGNKLSSFRLILYIYHTYRTCITTQAILVQAEALHMDSLYSMGLCLEQTKVNA